MKLRFFVLALILTLLPEENTGLRNFSSTTTLHYFLFISKGSLLGTKGQVPFKTKRLLMVSISNLFAFFAFESRQTEQNVRVFKATVHNST